MCVVLIYSDGVFWRARTFIPSSYMVPRVFGSSVSRFRFVSFGRVSSRLF